MANEGHEKATYLVPKVVATYSEQQLFADTEIGLASGWLKMVWKEG